MKIILTVEECQVIISEYLNKLNYTSVTPSDIKAKIEHSPYDENSYFDGFEIEIKNKTVSINTK